MADEKIYSRKRFLLNSNGKNSKKIIKIFILILIIILVFKTLDHYIEPIFSTMCEEKIKTEAIIITNQQSTIIMNKYQYDELYTIEKDEKGNILMIKSNAVPINNLISELTENIQHEFENIDKAKIKIRLGSLSGVYFLSATGPEIPIDVAVSGTVDTEIKSEFVAQGINQTLHRIYVNFDCDMKIVTPLKNYSENVVNQVIIAEHLIIGNIPSSYYNLEGFENKEETLHILE